MDIRLKPDSIAIKSWGLDSIVYMAVIVEYTESSTGRLFSDFTESTLKKALKHIPILEIRKSLNSLDKQGLISLQGVRIQIGEGGELYANSGISEEPFKHEASLIKALKALKSARIRGVDTEKYYNTYIGLSKIDVYNVEAYLKLYQCVYFAIFEEAPTTFSQKEKGQMSHLVKFYGRTNQLKNMIYEYIKNSEKYTKDFISIGGLLFQRHKVDAAVSTKVKTIKAGVDDEF